MVWLVCGGNGALNYSRIVSPCVVRCAKAATCSVSYRQQKQQHKLGTKFRKISSSLDLDMATTRLVVNIRSFSSFTNLLQSHTHMFSHTRKYAGSRRRKTTQSLLDLYRLQHVCVSFIQNHTIIHVLVYMDIRKCICGYGSAVVCVGMRWGWCVNYAYVWGSQSAQLILKVVPMSELHYRRAVYAG